MIKYRKGLFHDLDRRRLGYTDGRTAVRNTITARIAAIAATRQLVHHEVTAFGRVMPAKGKIAAGPGGGGSYPVGQCRHKGREHRLGDALRHFGGAA